MSKALKVEPNEMLDLIDDITQSMRMNYYPPCPQLKNVIGLKPHSDANALTILLQVNDTEGLQIIKDGQWISIKPLLNALEKQISIVWWSSDSSEICPVISTGLLSFLLQGPHRYNFFHRIFI